MEMVEFSVASGDITDFEVDAIVNAANSSLMGGGGVDGAIHRAGGPTIIEECRAIVRQYGQCAPGDAVATGGGLLRARWVIHAVGPIFTGDDAARHDQTLASTYRHSIDVANELGAGTVAFPNISTGVYGFPKERAAPIAVDAVRGSVADGRITEVIFVCHDEENRRLYEALLTPK